MFKNRFMSKLSLRSKKLLDYKILHTTGQRVYKGKTRDLINMERKQNFVSKLDRKIERFLDENVLSEFFDLDEIDTSVGVMRELLESYEDAHAELMRDLGDEVHAETYVEYAETMSKMTEWLKQSKIEIRLRKEKVLNREREREVSCRRGVLS